MAEDSFNLSISYSGNRADNHELDFYDASQALAGFQRTIALTMHLALNGEIITQAPSLRGAYILTLPPEDGTWRTTAKVVCTILGGIYALGIAPKDTPMGNISRSIYDYLLSETLGVHADYNKTIGKLIEEHKYQHPEIKKITPEKLDSLAEKCETAIVNMHRPIFHSETASSARILTGQKREETPLGPPLTRQTYEYVVYTTRSDRPRDMIGRVSSYNMNTFKGRIFVEEFQRPIPFELAPNCRDTRTVSLITNSLAANAQKRNVGDVIIVAFEDFSRTGRLKKLYVVEVRRLTVQIEE